MYDWLAQWLAYHPLDYLQIFLCVGGLMMVHGVLRASRNRHNKINVYDMLLGPDGKMSLTKTAQFGCFAISTWGFVHLVVYDHLTEWYYTSYMVAWAGTQVLTYYISKTKINVNSDDQEVAVQTPPTADVQVSTKPTKKA